MSKNLLIISFMAAFVVLTGTSCQQTEEKGKGTIEDVNGVTVVRNPSEPIKKAVVFRLEEELSITGKDGEGEILFNEIYDLAVDDEKNIYVSDMIAAHVLVFDRSGKHIKTIGKKGQGPGEMTRPLSICVFPPDKLLVQDVGQFCVHYFSMEGEYLKKYPTSLIGANFGRPSVDSKGEILAGCFFKSRPGLF